MKNQESINISMESINNVIFGSIRIYEIKKRADIPTIIKFEEKELLTGGNNLLKLLQEEISYVREEKKVKAEIMRMLSDKQSTFLCLHTNTMDAAVP